MDLQASWNSVNSLFQVSTSLGLPSSVFDQHYHVKLDGHCIVQEHSVLVTGHILDSWDLEALPCSERVVLRVRIADYHTTVKHSNYLRILFAALEKGAAGPVIDVTAGISVWAATVMLDNCEVLHSFELFSGGVAGWTQAAWVHNRMGRPLHMRWMLDAEDGCFPPARVVCPGLRKVSSLSQLVQLLRCGTHVFIHACVTESWWLRAMTSPCPHLLCASPPCQPWSTAASGLGLCANDGKLILHLTNLLKVFRFPLLCLEQVLGFCKHEHWPFIRDLWQSLGYRQVWHSSFDLGDVSPTSRPRFLSIWARVDCIPSRILPCNPPLVDKRPTLGTFDCRVDGNTPVHTAAYLSPDTLSVYLDPELLPGTKGAGKRGPTAQAFRIRGENDRAGCLMAQYHFQHELPRHCLQRKGLLGTLVPSADGPRFHNALEVAMLHVLVRPTLLQHCDRDNMLGNCLSPVQAALALEHALTLLCNHVEPNPTRVVQTCLDLRHKASNHLLLPCPEGWILARPDQLHDLIRCWPGLLAWGQLTMSAQLAFRQYWLHDDDRMCKLALPHGLTLMQAFETLGIELPAELAPEYEVVCSPFLWHDPVPLQDRCILEVPALPTLRLEGLQAVADALSGEIRVHPALHACPAKPAREPLSHGLQKPCLILTEDSCFLLDLAGPTALWSLSSLQELVLQASDSTAALWSTTTGVVIQDPRFPPPVCVLQVADPFDLISVTCCSRRDFGCVSVQSPEAPFLLTLQDPASHILGHGLQTPLYRAIGWMPVLLPAADRDNKQLLFRPTLHGLQMPGKYLRELVAEQLVAGALHYWPRPAASLDSLVPVKVQVWGRRVWQGSLPAGVTFGDVLCVWQEACSVCAAPANARVYSGPYPVDSGLTLAEGSTMHSRTFTTRSGLLCITVMPELRGGGAKDEKWLSAQTGLAQLCLEQGLRLPDATGLVDRLMRQAGLSRVARLLQLANPDQRWEEVRKLCSQHQFALPSTEPMQQRAQRRVNCRSLPLAEHFTLIEGYFRNDDNSPANVLTSLLPGCTGVILMNAAQAASAIDAFSGTSMDELAVVTVGHTCPKPSACGGKLTFAARNLANESVLVCGCLHQLGSKAIKYCCDHAAEVVIRDCVCMAISVFRVHWPDDVAWDNFVSNPVRAVQEKLQGCGLAKVLEASWGRQFRKAGAVSPAKHCDSVHFKARAPQADAEALLKMSGHNRIFLTPQNWKAEPHPDYAIVWMQGDVDSVCQAALRYQAQLGIAFVKSRCGIRVHKASFASAFAALRPGEQVPARMDIRHTYKG